MSVGIPLFRLLANTKDWDVFHNIAAHASSEVDSKSPYRDLKANKSEHGSLIPRKWAHVFNSVDYGNLMRVALKLSSWKLDHLRVWPNEILSRYGIKRQKRGCLKNWLNEVTSYSRKTNGCTLETLALLVLERLSEFLTLRDYIRLTRTCKTMQDKPVRIIWKKIHSERGAADKIIMNTKDISVVCRILTRLDCGYARFLHNVNEIFPLLILPTVTDLTLGRYDLKGHPLSNLNVEGLPKVRSLTLLSPRSSFSGLANMHSLIQLSLFDSTLQNCDFLALGECTQLRTLKFNSCKISCEALFFLDKLTRLKSLYFHHTNFSEAYSLQYLTTLANIKELRFSQSFDLQEKEMQIIGRLASLKRLSIQGNFHSNRWLENLTHPIETLQLHAGISDRSFEHLSIKSSIKGLSLIGGTVTAQFLNHFTELPTLEYLSLERCHDVDEAIIPMLQKITSLKCLRIMNCDALEPQHIDRLFELNPTIERRCVNKFEII